MNIKSKNNNSAEIESIKNILLIGGDERQIYTAEKLKAYGYGTELFGLDGIVKSSGKSLEKAIENAQAVVLPLPFSRDGENLNCPHYKQEIPIENLFELIKSDTAVFVGKLEERRKAELFRKGVRVFDYYEREETIVKNAVPTAEGVAAIIIEKLPITINGAKCLVTGYGRTGKAICSLLKAMNAQVTAAARKCSTLAEITSNGLNAAYVKEIKLIGERFDVLINTVPARIINKDELDALRRDCLIIEVASAPYGVDIEAATQSGNDIVIAGSLPGKVAPKTAGEIVGETILNIIEEGKK